MKNKATSLLKEIITALTTMAKEKTLALKSKTNSLKTKLTIFSLLANKKFLMTSISHKFQNLLTQHHHKKINRHDDDNVADTAIVLHRGAMCTESVPNPTHTEPATRDDNDDARDYYYTYDDDDDDDDKYPDLTHSLFDSEDFEDPGGSVIDIVKNSKEEAGESFSLEEEIDQVADLFIKRFHRQMRLQKMQSFKELQEMLQRGV